MPLIQCHVWEKVKNETEMTPEFLPSIMEISAADLARMGSIEPSFLKVTQKFTSQSSFPSLNVLYILAWRS